MAGPKKNADKATDSETAAPATPRKPTAKKGQGGRVQVQESPSQKLQKRTAAEARNPRDVFVLDADKVWSSERMLAGYLGLGGTAELNALPDLPANQLILKQYQQARASGFGGRSKTDKPTGYRPTSSARLRATIKHGCP